MKKFWNWIKNSDETRTLRLEGPIDEESFWGDEITPQMFRDELNAGDSATEMVCDAVKEVVDSATLDVEDADLSVDDIEVLDVDDIEYET